MSYAVQKRQAILGDEPEPRVATLQNVGLALSRSEAIGCACLLILLRLIGTNLRKKVTMIDDVFLVIAAPARGRMSTAPLHIADALRGAILDGRLAGGTALRQERLAEAFDTSRLPVREALRPLEAEGQ